MLTRRHRVGAHGAAPIRYSPQRRRGRREGPEDRSLNHLTPRRKRMGRAECPAPPTGAGSLPRTPMIPLFLSAWYLGVLVVKSLRNSALSVSLRCISTGDYTIGPVITLLRCTGAAPPHGSLRCRRCRGSPLHPRIGGWGANVHDDEGVPVAGGAALHHAMQRRPVHPGAAPASRYQWYSAEVLPVFGRRLLRPAHPPLCARGTPRRRSTTGCPAAAPRTSGTGRRKRRCCSPHLRGRRVPQWRRRSRAVPMDSRSTPFQLMRDAR